MSSQLEELPPFIQVITNNIYQRDYLPNQLLSTHRQNEMHIVNFQLSEMFNFQLSKMFDYD